MDTSLYRHQYIDSTGIITTVGAAFNDVGYLTRYATTSITAIDSDSNVS